MAMGSLVAGCKFELAWHLSQFERKRVPPQMVDLRQLCIARRGSRTKFQEDLIALEAE